MWLQHSVKTSVLQLVGQPLSSQEVWTRRAISKFIRESFLDNVASFINLYCLQYVHWEESSWNLVSSILPGIPVWRHPPFLELFTCPTLWVFPATRVIIYWTEWNFYSCCRTSPPCCSLGSKKWWPTPFYFRRQSSHAAHCLPIKSNP